MKHAVRRRMGLRVGNRPVNLLVAVGAILLVVSASSPAVPSYAADAPPRHVLPLSPQPIPDAGDVPISEPGPPGRTSLPWFVPEGLVDGIPATVLAAYQHATALTAVRSPACRLPMTLLAAIGKVETGHARGGRVDTHGTTVRPIVGPVLNGLGFAMIIDTDDGRLDGDAVWDRAVGPMQFLPQTWTQWAADGNADGQTSPHNVFDASLAAANYLCADNRDIGTQAGLHAAVLAYNHSASYLNLVLAWMNAYAGQTTPIPDAGSRPHVDTAGPVDLLVRAPRPSVTPAQLQPKPAPAPAVPSPAPIAAPAPSQEPPADVPPPSPPAGEQPAPLHAEPEPPEPGLPQAVCGMPDSASAFAESDVQQCSCTVVPPTGVPAESPSALAEALLLQLGDLAGRCAKIALGVVTPNPAHPLPDGWAEIAEHMARIGRVR